MAIPPTDVNNALYILAFGAHADDTDIGCSGTLAWYAQQGYRVGVCDLTHAELSTNGTVYTRLEEAKRAAEVVGLAVRLTLSFPDRGLSVRPETVSAVADIIRQYRPTYVFAPDWEDRHPDHRACAAIVEEGVFNAGLKRFGTPSGEPPHKVRHLFYYAINGMERPDIAVDISTVADKKKSALEQYGSQFHSGSESIPTPLNQGFVDAIIGRDALTGHQVGCRFAEGFRMKRPLLINPEPK
jgi:N-acetylglucosamine malate deacetylase 1